LSSDPQPSDAEIAVGQAAWEEEQSSKAARLVSAKSKLEALGLTTEEVQEAFGL
jgi:hypothetical protein